MNNKNRKYLLRCFVFLIIILIYMAIEPFWIQTKESIIKSTNIPKNFNNIKIIFISDIHVGPFFSKGRVKNLVAKVNSLNPDIIILGGDYVHRDRIYIKKCFDELKNLKSKYGTFAVLGNHDHWEGKNETITNIIDAKINYIDNNAKWISIGAEKIKIGGVGDYFSDWQDITPTIEDVTENDFVILVSHNPDYIEDIVEKRKIDLMLSGHTHGGQVTLFGIWAPLIPSKYGQKYRTGEIQSENIRLIVSNGIGTVTPPLRFFARPQINEIILKSN